MEKNPSSSSNKSLRKKLPETYLRYSSLGIQMGATVIIMTYAGVKLDQWAYLKFPVFTLLLLFTSVTGSVYLIYRSFNNKK